MMRKKGTLLISDVIFLVLTIAFITILVVFVAKQSSNYRLAEEKSAKEIALMIDAARQGTQITYYVGDLLEKKEEGYSGQIIEVNDVRNYVKVSLSENPGTIYGFFNDLSVNAELKGDYLILKLQ